MAKNFMRMALIFAKKSLYAMGVLVALGFLTWTWKNSDTSTWSSLWKAISLGEWLAAGLLWASSFIFRAYRLQQEWRWKHHAQWYEPVRITLLHNAVVLLMPFRAGELGYPILVKQVYSASWSEAIRSLLWLRLQDALVLVTLALLLWPNLHGVWRLLALPGLVIFCIPTRLWSQLLSRLESGAKQWQTWLPRTVGLQGWWLSLGNWLCKLLAVTALLHSMTPSALDLDLHKAMAGAIAGELAAMLPIQGPAGLGTYEAAVWVGSGLPFQAASALALTTLFIHGFFVTVSLGLAAVFLALRLIFAWRTHHPAQESH